jgi:DNA polymerase V
MCDALVLDMVEKRLATSQITVTIGYDAENLEKQSDYRGEVTVDFYGRAVPKHAHGSINFKKPTSSTDEIMKAAMELYDRIITKKLMVRRVNICACALVSEDERNKSAESEQIDFFTDYSEREKEDKQEKARYSKEKLKQNALIDIKKRFGSNAIIKGVSLEDGATAIDRNNQIGGHKA